MPVSPQRWKRSSPRSPRPNPRHSPTTTLPAGLAEQAIPYWLKAGQQAQKRSANLEALAHLGKGLELVASLPNSEHYLRQEIQLQTAVAVSMMAARGWGAPEVLQACTRARVLCEKLGDREQLFVALCGEASYHMISGNLRASDELGRQWPCARAGLRESFPAPRSAPSPVGRPSTTWETLPPPTIT
ncbi:MAG: hypothetical protein HC861_10785 [Rhodospirillaceae bacterium]|nr:hypothetical protein [Rhodospirillaceae bacterium]